jgi:hypothetical protein
MIRTRSTRSTRLATLMATVGFAALLALAPTGVTSSASAAAPVSQCNGELNADAQQIECQVVIENTLDLVNNTESSVVTVSRCAGAPGALTCSPPVSTPSTTLTTSVDQCNGSVNAGGSVLVCAVQITNTIIGAAQTTPATVNQCADSGQGGGESTLNCDSYETTTGATITQCNGSVNGGGAPTRANCSTGPSTQTTALPVIVNQCNGSVNGGGDLAFCSVQLINRGVDITYTGPDLTSPADIRFPSVGGIVVAPDVSEDDNAVVVPTPTPGNPGDGGGAGTPPGTPTPVDEGTLGASVELAATGVDLRLPLLGGALLLTLGGGFLVIALLRNREMHAGH